MVRVKGYYQTLFVLRNTVDDKIGCCSTYSFLIARKFEIRHVICIFSILDKNRRLYYNNDTERSGVWTDECSLNLESRIQFVACR